jgi:DNA-binding transcriptional regulator YhcF (GntR family)
LAKSGLKTNRGGKESSPKQSDNEKKSLVFYEKYLSAGYAAKELGLHRHTVEKYYQKFRNQEIEETTADFIKRQKSVKARVLERIDDLIMKAQAQVTRCELSETDYTPEGIQMERLLQKSITDLNSLYQDKASIEMSPTLDIHIEAEIEKKYGQPDENNSIIKHKSK